MSDWRIEEDHKAAVENPGDECGDRVLPYTGLRVIVRRQEAKRRFSGRSGGFAWRKGKLGKLTLLGGASAGITHGRGGRTLLRLGRISNNGKGVSSGARCRLDDQVSNSVAAIQGESTSFPVRGS